MRKNGRNGRFKVRYAVLGGAMGGLISSLISSPQSQFYWWNKEPTNRWNIVMWDAVAVSLASFILGNFMKKNWLKWISYGTLSIGAVLTYQFKKNPEFLNQAKSIEKVQEFLPKTTGLGNLVKVSNFHEIY